MHQVMYVLEPACHRSHQNIQAYDGILYTDIYEVQTIFYLVVENRSCPVGLLTVPCMLAYQM